MSTSYVNWGGNIFVLGLDGVPIKVPGNKTEDDPEGSTYTQGRGRYEIPNTHILFQISEAKKKIFLVVADKFTKIQSDSLMAMAMTHGQNFEMELWGCQNRNIQYEVEKLISAYNIYAKA